MTSGVVEHLRPSLWRRAKEVSGRAAEEKASAGDDGKRNALNFSKAFDMQSICFAKANLKTKL